jgi:uncharacterized membrane protein YciS (DUF1049 family)
MKTYLDSLNPLNLGVVIIVIFVGCFILGWLVVGSDWFRRLIKSLKEV